jgi:hypothetical protein
VLKHAAESSDVSLLSPISHSYVVPYREANDTHCGCPKVHANDFDIHALQSIYLVHVLQAFSVCKVKALSANYSILLLA